MPVAPSIPTRNFLVIRLLNGHSTSESGAVAPLFNSYPPLIGATSPVSFQVAKGNAALLAKINASLTKLKADGTIRPLVIAGLHNYP